MGKLFSGFIHAGLIVLGSSNAVAADAILRRAAKACTIRAMNTIPKYHLDGIYSPNKTHPDDAHSILMRLVPRESRVLELGCASGYLSGYMEQHLNCRVVGMDFDAAATAIAATRATEVYTVDLDDEDALALARSSAPYDVLMAAAILEHLRFPQRVLNTVHDLLTPDAMIIISLPNIAHWQFRLRLLRGQFEYEDYGVMDRTHTHLYTVKTGRALLEENGYRVTEFYIAGSLLQIMLNRITRAIGRKPLPPILPELLAYELIYVAKRA